MATLYSTTFSQPLFPSALASYQMTIQITYLFHNTPNQPHNFFNAFLRHLVLRQNPLPKSIFSHSFSKPQHPFQHSLRKMSRTTNIRTIENSAKENFDHDD
jgi:hypothetical protein